MADTLPRVRAPVDYPRGRRPGTPPCRRVCRPSSRVSVWWTRLVPVASRAREIVLSTQDLREVTGRAAESAQEVLAVFEEAHPADPRPRDAVEAAWAFARGGE